MGNPKGFLEVHRKEGGNRPVNERILDYGEVEQTLNEEDRRLQASRCMDCGVPFCQWGCPLMNNNPEWQDALYRGNWQKAITILHQTNNFPEFTGRICPALCEKSCTLSLHKEPVTIRENEAAAVERAFERGLIKPRMPKTRTGKKVAVIGSGPSGLACADLLNKAGHSVTVFEKEDEIGGLLRFGIPDFKLAKNVIDRRLALLTEEGIVFRPGVEIGKDIAGEDIMNQFDAICLAIGCMVPRDLNVEGRELKGVHFALEYLIQQNKIVRGDTIPGYKRITATGQQVLVIGGGDTGSDCVGTANRQRAKKVTQIEILPKPSVERTADNPWPYWANILKTTSSHEEGCERMWSVSTKRFVGENGHIKGVDIVDVTWEKGTNGRMMMKEVPGSERFIPAQLVLLSLGFVHPVHDGIIKELNLGVNERGNIIINNQQETNKSKVFATGDSVNGASLVVRAIASGRRTAEAIDRHLINTGI